MPDESKFPTMRFLRCRSCGNVFVQSLTGARDCPDCDSTNTALFRPGASDQDERRRDAGRMSREKE